MSEYDDENDSPRRSVPELQRIARYHRWLIATLLAQLTLWGGFILLMFLSGGGVNFRFALVLTCILGAVGGIYAFLLYCQLRRPFWGVVIGLAIVVPVLSLLAITVANNTASLVLKANGVKVGMFGANIDEIEEASLYDDIDDAGW